MHTRSIVGYFQATFLIGLSSAATCYDNKPFGDESLGGDDVAAVLRAQVSGVCQSGNANVQNNDNTWNYGLVEFRIRKADDTTDVSACEDAFGNIIDQCIDGDSDYPNNPFLPIAGTIDGLISSAGEAVSSYSQDSSDSDKANAAASSIAVALAFASVSAAPSSVIASLEAASAAASQVHGKRWTLTMTTEMTIHPPLIHHYQLANFYDPHDIEIYIYIDTFVSIELDDHDDRGPSDTESDDRGLSDTETSGTNAIGGSSSNKEVVPGCKLVASWSSNYGDVYYGDGDCLRDSSNNIIDNQCCTASTTDTVANPYYQEPEDTSTPEDTLTANCWTSDQQPKQLGDIKDVQNHAEAFRSALQKHSVVMSSDDVQLPDSVLSESQVKGGTSNGDFLIFSFLWSKQGCADPDQPTSIDFTYSQDDCVKHYVSQNAEKCPYGGQAVTDCGLWFINATS
ncbi:Uu.00g110520.m01.CDS01 [Anthostomella pinea]|uniref:Uu.00g110520.m01.CDS01 n=1 Tax=Anthostomella pinea TaxID=933095 RepID=A0AAI8YG95_9PEZI|nr:Uu.00g110520.m01.CDS01 [Anthostomella pinea]